MKHTILLAGSGNIGRRHLQALSALNRRLDLIVIEPGSSAREASAALLAPFSDHITLRAQDDWADLPPSVDLAIVATSAAPRRKVLESLLSATRPNFVLLEKVLFTTRRDLDECEDMLSGLGIPAAINCGRRGFHDYDRLRDELGTRRGLSMNVVGSDWNICSNGIHFLDLATHLFAEMPVSVSEAELEPEPVPSRHVGCVEFFGSLVAQMSGGGTIKLTSLRSPGVPLAIEVTHHNEKWTVEEAKGRVTYEVDGEEQYSRPFEAMMVSRMEHLYTEILDNRQSRLPSYQTSAAHHRLFIDAIRRRLGMQISEDMPCPIS
ncbi:Gfo/Idh/MocA family oxidoreductase [Sinorhizobium fredii]|uniref:Gfo/Idh/MocA family oxidoreductase n=1 Tax=Rhizobium fredii TaxID=380 RepID=UPI0005B53C5E|nr:Gfo/Idh/MocA family oxidoreductase [Sinorhizobium fredii]